MEREYLWQEARGLVIVLAPNFKTKTMKKELRNLIDLQLLLWTQKVLPEGDFSVSFNKFLADNIMKL